MANCPTDFSSEQRLVAIKILAQVVDEIRNVGREIVAVNPELAGVFSVEECQDVIVWVPGTVGADDRRAARQGLTALSVLAGPSVVNVGLSYDGSGHDFFSYNADVYEFEGTHLCPATKWRERLQELLGAHNMYFEDQNGYSLGIYLN